MGISLKFSHPGAETVKLNIRKDGPRDDKILAVDARVRGVVREGPWLRELFLPRIEADSKAFSKDLCTLLWLDDADANTRMIGVEAFRSNREFMGCELHLAISIQEPGIAKKFVMRPLANRFCEVEFTFSISTPEPRTVSTLAEMVGEFADCQLLGDDLLSQGEAA